MSKQAGSGSGSQTDAEARTKLENPVLKKDQLALPDIAVSEPENLFDIIGKAVPEQYMTDTTIDPSPITSEPSGLENNQNIINESAKLNPLERLSNIPDRIEDRANQQEGMTSDHYDIFNSSDASKVENRLALGKSYVQNIGNFPGLTVPYEVTSEAFLSEHPEWVQLNLSGQPMIQIAEDPQKIKSYTQFRSKRPGSLSAGLEVINGVTRKIKRSPQDNSVVPLQVRPVVDNGLEVEREGPEWVAKDSNIDLDLVGLLLLHAEEQISKSQHSDININKENLSPEQEIEYKENKIVAKNSLSQIIGRQATDQFKQLRQIDPEESILSNEEMTTIGDFAQELFFEIHGQGNNPLVERIDSSVTNDGSIKSPVRFTLTSKGNSVLNDPSSSSFRRFLLGSRYVEPRYEKLINVLNKSRGKAKASLSKRTEEARINFSNISFKTNNINMYMLFQLLIPLLQSRPNGEGYLSVFENIGEESKWKLNSLGLGQAKINDLTISFNNQMQTQYFNKKNNRPVSKVPPISKEYDAAVISKAKEMKALAMAHNLMFYFDTAIQGFSGRLDIEQTHLNPQANKITRGAMSNPVRYPVKLGSKAENIIRQMFALNFSVKSAPYLSITDGKIVNTGMKTSQLLFEERDRNLEVYSKMFEQWGDRLIEVFDLTANFSEDLSTMNDAIDPPKENYKAGEGHFTKLIKNNSLTNMNSPKLDPNNELDSKLISAIEEKGIESIAFMRDLVEFSKYNKWKRSKTNTPFYSNIITHIDGKTNGAAIIAMLLGNIDNLYKVGVLRSQGISTLDNGDLRDQLKSVLIGNLSGQPVLDWDYPEGLFKNNDGLSNSNVPFKDIHNLSFEVFQDRPMAKNVVMTWPYGKENDSYNVDIKQTIENLYQELKSIGEPSPFVTSYDNLKKTKNLNAASHMIHKKYIEGFQSIVTDDMLEFRSILRSLVTSYQLMDLPELSFEDYVGNKLSVTIKDSVGFQDETSNKFTLPKKDNTGKSANRTVTVGQYKTENTMTAIDRSQVDPDTGINVSFAGDLLHSSIIAKIIHSIDSSVMTTLLSGKNFKELLFNSGGNPFLIPVYDALYLDIGTFDTGFRLINKIIGEVTNNFNIFQKLLNSLEIEHKKYMRDLNKQNPKDLLTDREKRFFVDLFSYNTDVADKSTEIDSSLGDLAKFRNISRFEKNLNSFFSKDVSWHKNNGVQENSAANILDMVKIKYNFNIASKNYTDTISNLDYEFLQKLIPEYFIFLYGKNFSRFRSFNTKTHIQKQNAFKLSKSKGLSITNESGQESIPAHYMD